MSATEKREALLQLGWSTALIDMVLVPDAGDALLQSATEPPTAEEIIDSTDVSIDQQHAQVQSGVDIALR